jgi:5-formyltetrahydrofolate cyclo-ligase
MDCEKKRLRSFYSTARRALSLEERLSFDQAICNYVKELEVYQNASCVAGFIPHGPEPDIRPLLVNKRSFLPRYNEAMGVYEMVEIANLAQDLALGHYGIPEPRKELKAASPEIVENELLFLVPALSCDRTGRRLGRGGGFYDRMLAGAKLPPIGIIYACQFAEKLPFEDHDLPVSFVVTEQGATKCELS